MLIILAIAIVRYALPTIARLMVEAIATVIALRLLRSSGRTDAALIARSEDRRDHPAGWDASPPATERRLLRRGLTEAMRLTELASLFPTTVDRARRFA